MPPGEQAHGVDLVCGLTKHHAATLRRVQLFRAPRAIKKIGKIHGMQHAYLSIAAAVDQAARHAHWRIEAVAVTNDEVGSGLHADSDHALTIRQAERHGFFHQHVLSMAGSQRYMFRMKLVGGSHVDPFHLRIGTYGLR